VRLIQTVRGGGLRASHHVTFRSRVITATVAAAAIAVILACFASFLTTRNSLIHSVDESLHAEATPSGGGHEISFVAFLVLPTGQTVLLPTGQTVPSSRIHRRRDDPGRRQGKSQPVYRTVAIGGNQLPRAHRAHRGQFNRDVRGRQRLSDQDDVGRTVHHQHRRSGK